MAPERGWRKTIRTGLLWGTTAIFIALVGLAEVLQKRQIITGVISGGHALLLAVALAAGVYAARQHRDESAGKRLAAGAVAGLIAGGMVAALVAVSTVINFRAMIVGATPELFALLSLGRGVAGLPWIVLLWTGVALLGAILTLLPGRVRSALTTGFGVLLGVGLLQEQVQLLLQSDRVA